MPDKRSMIMPDTIIICWRLHSATTGTEYDLGTNDKTVRLNGSLAKGDCGSWIIDAETRGLYGHIIAGYERPGTAYIKSAQNVLEDAKERLGGGTPAGTRSSF
jgi:hypothetical protein